jgi:hypothetical protein
MAIARPTVFSEVAGFVDTVSLCITGWWGSPSFWVHCDDALAGIRTPTDKSFLVLFFKKELLSSAAGLRR